MDTEFQNITRLLDQMTDFMDECFLDSRCELFNDPLRDEQFVRTLHFAHGGKKFCAEAFATVKQRLDTISNLKEQKCDFEPAEHHM